LEGPHFVHSTVRYFGWDGKIVKYIMRWSSFRNVYVINSHFVGDVIVYTLPFILYKAVM